MNLNHINYFQSLLGDRALFDQETLNSHGSDHTENLNFPPEMVLMPINTEEVSKILKYTYKNNIPVTPIGALTGLSGGALSIKGGVGLSLMKMNQILDIDTENYQCTVEPGVINEELQNHLDVHNLYYPPDPASKGSCSLGGNIAENSGGPHALKYGVTSHYVLNLEVVLPNGDVIWTGANTLKNSTGYNLTQLFVGSEGTLGVATKIVLKLIAKPTFNQLILVPFKSEKDACDAVNTILGNGLNPSALEFMEQDAIIWTMEFTKESPIVLKEDEKAHLLIEFDGFDEELIQKDIEKCFGLLEDAHEVGEILYASSEAEKEKLWFLRRRVGEAVKAKSIYKEEDTVVPRAKLPALIQKVKSLGNSYGFKTVCYGHAGDGNLHVNIIKGDLSEEKWKNLNQPIAELFTFVKENGGTISGEHGIGWVQKEYLSLVFNKTEIDLMKAIKEVFDPKNLMNPGKIWI